MVARWLCGYRRLFPSRSTLLYSSLRVVPVILKKGSWLQFEDGGRTVIET
jgi:hypothetical protein